MRALLSAMTAVLSLNAAGASGAASCSVSSGPGAPTVIELYTSEGCNSCPPADRWLSEIGAAYPKDVLPLAFHVDYWDYIGWKDPYAQPAFSARQRLLGERQKAGVIYTPQVIFNGKDMRSWRDRARIGEAMSAVEKQAAPAQLKLELQETSAAKWSAALNGQVNAVTGKPVEIYLAVLESGLTTQVRAGENAGATLRHDHVVREWLGPFKPDAAGGIDMRTELSLSAAWPRRALEVAAIAYAVDGSPLQAVRLPLCSN